MAPQKKVFSRRRVCRLCTDKELVVDYKDAKVLRGFVTERGKIIPKRIFGTCASHQKQVTEAIKRARHLAILPYSGQTQF
jgi:small subunit ribosomal protein S18